MATFDDVRRLITGWPETEASTSYGTPAFKVRKKWICRLWSQREHDRYDVHAALRRLPRHGGAAGRRRLS